MAAAGQQGLHHWQTAGHGAAGMVNGEGGAVGAGIGGVTGHEQQVYAMQQHLHALQQGQSQTAAVSQTAQRAHDPNVQAYDPAQYRPMYDAPDFADAS
mmetsp:Transcript_20134/g.24109  ORF Transcript_20134/g.24109 Transcript_20134/m.24109 type:complete len:98 (-) Transcript_20134:73-366(-)